MDRNSMVKVERIKQLDSAALTKIFTGFSAERDGISAEAEGDFRRLEGVNDNYNSEVRKLNVIVRKNGETFRTVHIIFKLPFERGFLRHMQKLSRPLSKEVIFYTRIVPELAKLCPQMKSLLPDCYYGYSTKENAALNPRCWDRASCIPCLLLFRKPELGMLMLEDLSYSGFTMADKNKILSLDHVKMALETLAVYHGAWWKFLNAKEENRNALFTRSDLKLVSHDVLPVSFLKDMIQKTFVHVSELMKMRGESEELIQRFQTYGKRHSLQKLTQMLKDPTLHTSKIKTICHGDYWSNNMMFRHDESSGKPIEIRLIDFQMLAPAHPARDICYFLYVNTDRAFREKHLDELIKLYHSKYSQCLSPHYDLSLEEFVKEFQARRDFGLVGGLLVVPNVLSPNKRELQTMREFAEFSRQRHLDITSPELDSQPKIKEIRRRCLDIVHEFADLGTF